MQSLLGHIPYNNVYISYLSYLSYHLSCVAASAHHATAPLTPVAPPRPRRHVSCRSALPPVVSPSHCHESCPRHRAATHCTATTTLRPVMPQRTAGRCVVVASVCCIATVAVPPVAPPSCLLPIVPPRRCWCRPLLLLLLPITTALLLWALASYCHHVFPATAAGITIVSPLPLVPTRGGG